MGKVKVVHPPAFRRISKLSGGIGGELQRQLKSALQESLEEGRDEMRRLIETRGTGKTWVANWDSWANATPGRRASAPGRVGSGRMRDEATFAMSPDTKNRIVGRVGWVGRIGADRKYFMAQEQGFRHNITGQQIAGMMILRQVADFVDDRFAERAEAIALKLARFDF